MPEEPPPSRRSLLLTTVAFVGAVAVGWVLLYLAYRYLFTDWRV